MIQTAVELTAAAREAGGPDLDLIIELHRKLTPMVSLALAEALKPFHVFFLEDPIQIDSISAQAHIAQKSTVPFGNGERFVSIWEFRELLEQGGPQYLRPDVALAGGISHCKKNRRHRRSLPLRGSNPQLLGTADYRCLPAPRRLDSQLYYPRIHQRRRSPAQRDLPVRV